MRKSFGRFKNGPGRILPSYLLFLLGGGEPLSWLQSCLCSYSSLQTARVSPQTQRASLNDLLEILAPPPAADNITCMLYPSTPKRQSYVSEEKSLPLSILSSPAGAP